MVKKIVHLSDLHVRTYKRLDEYKEICEEFLTDVKHTLRDYSYDEIRIVIVGDLVHQKITISNEQLLFLSWFLKSCSKIAPLVVVAGNHDLLESNKERMDSLTPVIALLDDNNISYYKESECYVDENIVWCNYSIFEDNKRPEIYESKKLNPDKKHIGLIHSPIIGSKTDIGYEFENGIEVDYFDGCDAVMCGDIHKRQRIPHETIPIMMPSSLIQQDYGENISKHGYLIWDVNTLEYEERDIENDYGFYKFNISSLDDLNNDEEKLMNK